MSKKIEVAVLGAGNMGTALAQVIGQNGYRVRLWNYEGDPEPLIQIKELGENKKYLPGIVLSSRIKPEPNVITALKGAQLVCAALPSSVITNVLESAKDFLTKDMVVLDVSKGFTPEQLEGLLQSQIKNRGILQRLPRAVTISGPAIAFDLAKGGFTTMNVAGKDASAVALVRRVLENDYLKLVLSNDLKGVKLCGALKNMYAILLGIADGLDLPMNTKSFLLVESLGEMARVVKKMGGKIETVYGLAGLGDVVGTGFSTTSRNRRFGEFLVRAANREEAEEKVGQVVEGVVALKIMKQIAKAQGLELPLMELLYRAVWQGRSPGEGLISFLKKFK